jgi:hypothetical protein
MEAALKQVGIMVVKLMLEYYTEPRIMRILGEGGKFEAIKLFKEPDLEKAKTIKQLIEIDPNTGQPTGMKAFNLSEIDPDFDLNVTIEPAMPLSKSARFQQGEKLLSLGAIDPQAMLDISDFPDKEKIKERMKQQAEASMKMAKEKEMFEGKVKTAPKLSLALRGEDLTPDEKGQILEKNGIRPNEARGVQNAVQEQGPASVPMGQGA